MEVDHIQCNSHTTFINAANATLTSAKAPQDQTMDDQLYHPDEEDDGGEPHQIRPSRLDLAAGVGRFYGWPSSRIVRVTRASGGKDRHSKVLTSKGLRDRRVRLSVNTAIQFYDLQDRLGYDQPSKAVEWLLKAAASSIDELPPVNPLFPETPKQASAEKRSSSDEVGLDATADTGNYLQQVTKSSSNSETSKGSGASRSEHRTKARERARERAAGKDKDKRETEVHPNSQITSFTELLNAGFNHETSSNRQWSDYLTPQMQLVNSLKRNPFTLTATGYFNPDLQNMEFGMVNGDVENNGSYNLNFAISSAGVAGFNRGTLQSNSTSSSSPLLPPAPHQVHTHHSNTLRFAAASSTGLLMAENHHPHEFQLFYAGQKEKGKDQP